MIFESEHRHIPDDSETLHQLFHDELIPLSHTQSPKYDGYFKFTFVRNPWDRLVSCYNNKVLAYQPGKFLAFKYRYALVPFGRMSFTDFVRFVCRVPNDLCEPHFKLQSDFFEPEKVDFIGRFEHFPRDLERVIDLASLDASSRKWCSIKRMTIGKQSHYTEYYNAKTRRLVAEKYKKDIEQFGYRFGD